MTRFNTLAKYVPPHVNPTLSELNVFKKFFDKHKKICVITGAGVSTESGIPDYRSDVVGLYARSNSRPLQYAEFLRSENARKKYWARNYAGWDRFSGMEPNTTHQILSQWERDGKVSWLVTQNVDGLHRKAGSALVTELHGCMYEVECLKCEALFPRSLIQGKIKSENPNFSEEAVYVSPDADVFIPDERIVDFVTPFCDLCGGILKPRVVFFGDNVKNHIKEETKEKIFEADALLAIGTSIQTYSCLRLVEQAYRENKPVFIINIGPTRADNLAKYKIESLASMVLGMVTNI